MDCCKETKYNLYLTASSGASKISDLFGWSDQRVKVISEFVSKREKFLITTDTIEIIQNLSIELAKRKVDHIVILSK